MEIRVQSCDDTATRTREGEDVLVLGFLHSELGDTPTFVASVPEEGRGVHGETLIKEESERYGLGVVHAAGISEVSSARFAAADSSAWRMSSSSRSG
jgi:hypothetical protein